MGPRGVCFGLTPAEREPDLALRGDWAAMVRVTRARYKEGREEHVDLQQIGDASAITRTAEVFEAAQRAATVDCEYPSV